MQRDASSDYLALRAAVSLMVQIVVRTRLAARHNAAWSSESKTMYDISTWFIRLISLNDEFVLSPDAIAEAPCTMRGSKCQRPGGGNTNIGHDFSVHSLATLLVGTDRCRDAVFLEVDEGHGGVATGEEGGERLAALVSDAAV